MSPSDAIRFWAKVRIAPGDCWEWTAARNLAGRGYGIFNLDGKMRRAHRVAYELLVGTIPDGLQLDHLCRNPPCVNPAHLEAVTAGVNLRRSTAPAVTRARHAAITHCPHGHAYSGTNVHIRRDGKRRCRACQRRWSANHRRRLAHVAE